MPVGEDGMPIVAPQQAPSEEMTEEEMREFTEKVVKAMKEMLA